MKIANHLTATKLSKNFFQPAAWAASFSKRPNLNLCSDQLPPFFSVPSVLDLLFLIRVYPRASPVGSSSKSTLPTLLNANCR